jgi:hypothetical protein
MLTDALLLAVHTAASLVGRELCIDIRAGSVYATTIQPADGSRFWSCNRFFPFRFSSHLQTGPWLF